MDSDSKNRNWSKLLDRTGEKLQDKPREKRGDETASRPAPADTRFDDEDGKASVAPLSHSFSEGFGRAEASISAEALNRSYKAIQEQVPTQAILPMVKADAYGHSAAYVVRILKSAPNLYGFGVATLEEGREVREILGAKGRKTRVLVLSGSANWTEDKGQYCERFGLTPTLTSEEDWKSFLKGKWPERLKYHLKFNTGMNRLGISPGHVSQVVSQLKDKPAEWRPEGVATHFAVAEEPDHALTQRQVESFRAITGAVKSIWTDTLFHCANSAAIWNARKMGLEGWTDFVRPGISLYGVSPWAGAPMRGLMPAMELRYSVIQRRTLKPGESIGYGASFRLKGSEPAMEIAILGAGYADGLHRMNSNEGRVLLGGKLRRFLGRVSMDLSVVECDASTRVGDWVQILGEGLDPWTQAKAAGTIPYELLTSVSRRVRRLYE